MKYIILEKAKQVQVKPYQRKGKMVLGYHRLDPRQKMTAMEAFMGGGIPKKGWQKEAAEKFVSEMNPIFDKYGYKVEITGSVSRGKVYKEGHWDLDLKLTHTKPDERATAESIEEELTGDLGRLLREFEKKGIETEYHELSGDEDEPSATLHLKDGRVVDLYEYDPYIEGELPVESKFEKPSKTIGEAPKKPYERARTFKIKDIEYKIVGKVNDIGEMEYEVFRGNDNVASIRQGWTRLGGKGWLHLINPSFHIPEKLRTGGQYTHPTLLYALYDIHDYLTTPIKAKPEPEKKLYHGTYAPKIYSSREDVPEEYLDPGQASSLGIYFTDSPEMAQTFGKKVFTAKPPKNTLDLTEAKTVDDYVDLLKIDKEKHGWAIRNLKVDSAFFDDRVEDSYRLLELLNQKFNIVDTLKQKGYDSIKFKEEHSSKKGNTVVIFDPEKVKWIDVEKSMKYIVLEKGKKIYVPASIKQKAYWRYDPRTKMAKQVLHAESIYHAPSTLEKIVNNIKSLLEKIGLMKKKGLFTSEQRKYARRRLMELEPKLKYFRTKKQRLAVSGALKQIRKELEEKATFAKVHKREERKKREEHKQETGKKREEPKQETGKFNKEIMDGLRGLGFLDREIRKMSHREAQVFYYKDISKEMYLGLRKLGYTFIDVEKMSSHEAKATYWNEISKEPPKEEVKAEEPKDTWKETEKAKHEKRWAEQEAKMEEKEKVAEEKWQKVRRKFGK